MDRDPASFRNAKSDGVVKMPAMGEAEGAGTWVNDQVGRSGLSFGLGWEVLQSKSVAED